MVWKVCTPITPMKILNHISYFGLFSLFWGLTFVDIYSESETFAQRYVGIDGCPEGYKAITEPSNCQTASKILDLEYDAGFNTNVNDAICYLDHSSQTTRVSGRHGDLARWIFQAKGRWIRCLTSSILTKNSLQYYSIWWGPSDM